MVVIVKEGKSCDKSVQRQSEKFDGLANDYDCYRPLKNKKHLSIVDV
ncbi:MULTISPECIES: hypothetical protein [unclassified Bartonella]